MRSLLDVRNHPLRAGLAWAVLYAPLSILIHMLFGETLSVRRIVIIAALAIPFGILWGYSTKFVLKGSPDRAR